MTLEEIAALEQQWIGQVQIDQPDVYFDWQPASVELFTGLLEQCLSHVPSGNQTFLDVGCGIGTKCILAAQYGLVVNGFDRVPEYLTEAAQLGISAIEILAEDFADYGDFGIVYMNHPLITIGPSDNRQALLAAQVHEAMASRSVLLSINYDLAPGCLSHLPDRSCDTNCRTDAYDGWTEFARDGHWNAAWVKS